MGKSFVYLGALCAALSVAEARADGRNSITDKWEPVVMTQRDQGQLGTCHAFSCLPSLDFLENSSIAFGSRQFDWVTSENWLVFLATVGKICDPNFDDPVRINQGGSAATNMDMVLKYGYCENQMYSKYERNAAERSLSKSTTLDDIYTQIAKASANMSSGSAGGLTGARGVKGAYAPGLEKRFEESFGVTVDDARSLCTDKPADAMSALIKKVNARWQSSDSALLKGRMSAFMACATQAQQKQKKLADDGCEYKQADGVATMTDDEKVAALKQLIDDGKAPINVGMRNYPNGQPRGDQHGNHAFTLIGYDDRQKIFITRNSWGERNNLPVRYEHISFIYRYGNLECANRKLPERPRAKFRALPNRRGFEKDIGNGGQGGGSGRNH